jgi:hypothetical protein
MQNFRTRTVHLNQAQYLAIQAFPFYDPPGYPFFSEKGYQVVDVVLKGGATYEGLLVVRDDHLLVPESLPEFNDRDIAELRATPPERHPDFTITDPDALYQGIGIEIGNSIRLSMFGPKEEEKNWREAPIGEAHMEALYLNSSATTFGGELPAVDLDISLLGLTKGGMRISYQALSSGEAVEAVLRPQGAPLWRALLDQFVTVEDGFTLGEMLRLLDLPEEVGREVFLRTMPAWYGAADSFRPWVEALRDAPETEREGGDIEYIEVQNLGHYNDRTGRFWFDHDVMGYSSVIEEDDEESGTRKGQRVNWGTGGLDAAAWMEDVPLVYNDAAALPAPFEARLAHMRSAHLEWLHGDRSAPMPEMPAVLRTKMEITLREFIGALFSNLDFSSEDDEGDPYLSAVLADALERVEADKAARAEKDADAPQGAAPHTEAKGDREA